MSAEKRKGDTFERAVVEVFRAHGHPHAERTLRLGAHDDRGDITGVPGVLIDAKNHRRLEIACWLDALTVEAKRCDGCPIPVVVVKRRGKGAEHAYAVLELADLAELLA